MRQSTRRLVTCLACATALILPRGQDLCAADLTAKRVVDSIDKAKQVLLKAQQPDGSWKTGGGNDQYVVGVTSLALLALLNTGLTAADPEIKRGLDRLRPDYHATTDR